MTTYVILCLQVSKGHTLKSTASVKNHLTNNFLRTCNCCLVDVNFCLVMLSCSVNDSTSTFCSLQDFTATSLACLSVSIYTHTHCNHHHHHHNQHHHHQPSLSSLTLSGNLQLNRSQLSCFLLHLFPPCTFSLNTVKLLIFSLASYIKLFSVWLQLAFT